jgi:hypothetical protein
MSNSYAKSAAESAVPCTPAQCAELATLLNAPPANDAETHGFKVEPYGKGAFLFAEYSAHPEYLPEPFMAALAGLLRAANMSHLEIGCAYSCDRLEPGAFGGESYRITDEGKLVRPAILWP